MRARRSLGFTSQCLYPQSRAPTQLQKHDSCGTRHDACQGLYGLLGVTDLPRSLGLIRVATITPHTRAPRPSLCPPVPTPDATPAHAAACCPGCPHQSPQSLAAPRTLSLQPSCGCGRTCAVQGPINSPVPQAPNTFTHWSRACGGTQPLGQRTPIIHSPGAQQAGTCNRWRCLQRRVGGVTGCVAICKRVAW